MNITKFKTVSFCLVGLFLSVPATAFAGAESGFFIGAGVGDATVEADGTDPTHGAYSFDGSDSAYKFFGGYNFGVVPFIDLAVEASYVDFGQPHSTFPSGEPIKLEVSGINAYGLAGASFGPFGIFAKALNRWIILTSRFILEILFHLLFNWKCIGYA